MTRHLSEHLLTATLLGRFVTARWGRRSRSRAAFERRRARLLAALLRRAGRSPFYASRVAPGTTRLADFPVVDKHTVLAHFDELNIRGVRLAEALAVALEAERSRDFAPVVAGDLTVGLSSGTSGRRGVFLVSPRERMLWAGTVLGRLLDTGALGRIARFWEPPLRIAFFLRAGGHLYESVSSSRVRFTFFDLTEPLDVHRAELARAEAAGEAPELLVAPASMLDALARDALAGASQFRPLQVVSVAEVLEPDLARRIEAAWGRPVRQVYQATEGLLGVTCSAGALHLNEESVLVEREWLDAARTRFVPVLSDVERRTQLVLRYRLDDVLRIDPAAPERCSCGRVSTVVAEVEGRADAVLELPATDGRRVVELFPDTVRQAFASVRLPQGGEPFADWTLRQRGLDLHVSLLDPAPGAVDTVVAAIERLLESHGCAAQLVVEPWAGRDPATKLRRIAREPAA
ncbi:F390 synthetase-related protein [Herbiconiux sp. A18JL235]|uniref:F390 synthetase-related protein n=1 Tax=Herbiconiux sp. A18JL235 TaxID=3152363 RepID=A0AB39BKJ1_9MICO